MRQTERQLLRIGVRIRVGLSLVGLFVSDWVFDRNLLTETWVGLLRGTPLGWMGAYVAFSTVESPNTDDESESTFSVSLDTHRKMR